MEPDRPAGALEQVHAAGVLRLFLDYDGTLADFAPTPDVLRPDAELVELLARLVEHPRLIPTVISGRRLSHIRTLIPIPGITLAGVYGIELLLSSGRRIDRLDFEAVRPALEKLKPRWEELIRPLEGFYLEDKGWSLALHARFATEHTAQVTLEQARTVLEGLELPSDPFRIIAGHKFLEIAPRLADKSLAVGYLIAKYPLDGALPVYIGDDDRDEEAFGVILQHSGVAIKVCLPSCNTLAQVRLDSPRAVRRFLASLL